MEHRDRLVAFFRSRVTPREEAEDLAQEVLLRAHQKRDTLDDAARFDAWLFAIARNALTDHYRRRARPAPPEDALHPAQDEAAEMDELSACVRPLVATLKPQDREALEQVDLQGRRQSELARELGLSGSGMKSRVQRARRRLLDALLACCAVELDARGKPLVVVAKDGCACS